MAMSFSKDEIPEGQELQAPVLSQSVAVGTGTWNYPFEVVQLKENEIIFKDGEAPRGLYFVKSGCVKVVTNRLLTRGRMNSPEYITNLIGPGEFFGFKALISGTVYNYSAKTLRPTEVQLFSKDIIGTVMNGPNTVLRTLLSQIVKDIELNESNSQLHYLASVQERIAHQLLLLSDKFGVEREDGLHLNLRLTRNELAQLAGTINESLSRHLTEFRTEGIVDLNGKEIIIKNREALMAKSGNIRA